MLILFARDQVLLHGLNGSSDDAYVRFLAAMATRPPGAAAADGGAADRRRRRQRLRQRPPFRVAGYLMRGCGGLRLTTRRGYSAADTCDLAAALGQVAAVLGYCISASLFNRHCLPRHFCNVEGSVFR